MIVKPRIANGRTGQIEPWLADDPVRVDDLREDLKMLSSDNIYGLSTLRLLVMRVPYFFTGVLFTFTAWSTLIDYWGDFEPMEGVAYAFWGALSILAIFGLRFPIKMLPVLLIQFGYKLIWIAAVGYPLLARGELDESAQDLFKANVIGVIIDTIAIPWLYVLKTYVAAAFIPSEER
ncbi:MAG: hypothetical protein AAF936_03840 [Pseudomonadota bacterium]